MLYEIRVSGTVVRSSPSVSTFFPISEFLVGPVQRVPALRAFWDLEKTVLHEILVSGTVGGPLLTQKSPLART